MPHRGSTLLICLFLAMAMGSAPMAPSSAAGAPARGALLSTAQVAPCTIEGTDGPDELTGTPGDDVICGLRGADVISGGGGDDVIRAGGGKDILQGGAGDDQLLGHGGDDSLAGGPGDDVLVGGGGSDVADYTGATSGVTVTLGAADPQNTGGAGVDTLGLVENLVGSAFDDVLVGDANDNRLVGAAGADALVGGAGADQLIGGPGADNLAGGPGPDSLLGGPASDGLRGGAGADRATGQGGRDVLRGGGAADRLRGGEGKDRMFGAGGNDRLLARDHTSDRLEGGPGRDAGRLDASLDRVTSVERRIPGRGITQRVKDVAPGIRLLRIVHRRGPKRVFVLEVAPGQEPTLDAALARRRLPGVQKTGRIARREGAIAAVNGDFAFPSGRPVHAFASDGDLKETSAAFGVNFGISQDESETFFAQPGVSASARVAGSNTSLTIGRWNHGPAPAGEVAAFTPEGWTLEAPPAGACAARLRPEGPLRWATAGGVERDHVVEVAGCFAEPLPRQGNLVLTASPGTAEATTLESLQPGTTVTVGWSFGWEGVVESLGGFPMLVSGGAAVATKCASSFCSRNPRTAVGVTAEGKVLLVVVDGRRPGWSVGMTLVELARELKRLGARFAVNLDGGGSSTMVVRRRVVNKPSGGSQRGVSSALLVRLGPDPLEEVPLAAVAGPPSVPAPTAPAEDEGGVPGVVGQVPPWVTDPGSTGGLIDALSGGELGAPAGPLPREFLEILRLFRDSL